MAEKTARSTIPTIPGLNLSGRIAKRRSRSKTDANLNKDLLQDKTESDREKEVSFASDVRGNSGGPFLAQASPSRASPSRASPSRASPSRASPSRAVFLRSISYGDMSSSPLRESYNFDPKRSPIRAVTMASLETSSSSGSSGSCSPGSFEDSGLTDLGTRSRRSQSMCPKSILQAETHEDSHSQRPRRRHSNTAPVPYDTKSNTRTKVNKNVTQRPKKRSDNLSASGSAVLNKTKMQFHSLPHVFRRSSARLSGPPLKSPRASQPLSPRGMSPVLSPRNPLPKSPRTPRGSIKTSYMDAIRFVQRRNSATNSPRPSEILGFCCSGEPICLFYGVQSRKEVGRRLLEHPKLWRHLLRTVGHTQTKELQPEILYDLLDGLEINFKLPQKTEFQTRKYKFISLPLNEIKANIKVKRYVALMKDGQVQEIMDCHDPDLLVQNFKHNYHRYVPIYKWFQEHGYQDFMKSPRQNLHELVQEMGVHKLYGYIENTSISCNIYVNLKVIPVY